MITRRIVEIAAVGGGSGGGSAGLIIRDTAPSSANLPLTGNQEGDIWITTNTGHCWIWDGDSWEDMGSVQGPAGPTGPQGATGATGVTGAPGATGPSNVLTVASTTTSGPGTNANVTIAGTSPAQSLTFTIPRGDTGSQGATGTAGSQGPQGNPGTAATATAGTTTTGAAGTNASVVNAGTTSAAVFNFTIPRGDQGIQGIPGPSGSGAGDVTGPASAVSGRIATYNGTTGKVIQDGGKLGADLVTGPASATTGRIASYGDTTGKVIADGAKLAADLVTGPASATTGNVASYNGATGKIIADGAKLVADLVTGPASSVDSEVVLFSSTTGKLLKRATGTGVVTLASGVQTANATLPYANMPVGSVIQTMYVEELTEKTTALLSGTPPFTTSTGTLLFSITMTPQISTSKVLLRGSGFAACYKSGGGNNIAVIMFFAGSTWLGAAYPGGYSDGLLANWSFQYLHTPAAGSTVYMVRFANSATAGTLSAYINGLGYAPTYKPVSSFTVQEIKQ